MPDYADKEKDFETAFNNAYDLWFPWLDEAHTDWKYVLKDPWTEADRAYFKDQDREILNFNITRRIVKLISGYERQHRLALSIGPSESSDETVASQLTGIIMPLMENNRGYEVVSDAFEFGAVIAGMNLVETYIDRWGNIQFARKPYNKFLLDPHFTRRDLKDCSYIIIHEEGMLTEDVKSLIPGKEKIIEEYAKADSATGILPFSAYRGRGREEGKRCNYQEFWERTTKKVKILANRRTSQKFVWRQGKEKLEEIINNYPLQLVSYDDWIETVEFSAFVNGRCVHKGDDPNKIDDYPHVLIAGFWYPEYDDYSVKLQGVVRPTRDPQREVSKRISKILDMIDSQVSTGLMAEEKNTLVNPDDIHASGQGKGIWLREGALSAGRVQKIQASDIPQGLFQLNHDLQSMINDIACVNDSMFGNDELKGNVSGYLVKLRTGAGLVALQDLFDNRRFSLKQLVFKIIKLVQKNYSPQKIFRIINEQPAPNFYTEDLAQYDCTPKEGILTETQGQMFYNELLYLKSVGFNIPEEAVIEAFPVQFRKKLKDKILQAIERQRQAEAEKLKEKQLLDQMRAAKIAADFGRAAEREANVEEHRADAALKRIKTAKELQNMDWQKVMDVIDRVTALETSARRESMTRR
jgi:hypothetical protein